MTGQSVCVCARFKVCQDTLQRIASLFLCSLQSLSSKLCSTVVYQVVLLEFNKMETPGDTKNIRSFSLGGD